MKRKSIILLLCLATILPVAAQKQAAVRWEGADRLILEYDIKPERPKSDYAYTVTPLLCSAEGDTLQLASITWRGQRNVKKLKRTLYFQGHRGELPPYRAATDTATQTVRSTIEATTHPWITRSALHLCFLNDTEGCCNVEQKEVEGTPFIYLPPFEPRLNPVADRTGKEEYLRTETMGLYVYFPLNSAKLSRNFRNNAATLDSIVVQAERTLARPISEVKRIEIIGLASPDGPLKRNLTLARQRAEALKAYVRQRIPAADSLFVATGGGEGWEQLRRQIAESEMPERDSLLNIIDTESDPEQREQRIKRYNNGKSYDYLRRHILADQRNSGYMHIHYVYLEDKEAPVINRAIALIGEGKADEALSILQPVKHDLRAQSAMGTALYLCGETEQAVEILSRATRQGNIEAEEKLKQIKEIENRIKILNKKSNQNN